MGDQKHGPWSKSSSLLTPKTLLMNEMGFVAGIYFLFCQNLLHTFLKLNSHKDTVTLANFALGVKYTTHIFYHHFYSKLICWHYQLFHFYKWTKKPCMRFQSQARGKLTLTLRTIIEIMTRLWTNLWNSSAISSILSEGIFTMSLSTPDSQGDVSASLSNKPLAYLMSFIIVTASTKSKP